MQLRVIPGNIQIVLLVAALGALLQLDFSLFIYQRDVMSSEIWRWWTAHWVHLGWRHYGLNILAFLCLPFIFPHLKSSRLIVASLTLPPLLSGGLYWLLPNVSGYAGLSGVLHGFYVLAAIEALTRPAERQFAVLVLACIVLKISIEHWVGYTDTAKLIHAPVLIESHQLGVVCGVIFAVIAAAIPTTLKTDIFRMYDKT